MSKQVPREASCVTPHQAAETGRTGGGMTGQAELERRYRRLLAWYPRAFRRESGPEILAVLLAAAAAGQQRPRLAQSADLIRGGLWMRLRPSVPKSARTVRAAVRLLCAGAAVSTTYLAIALAFSGNISNYHVKVLGHYLTAARFSHLHPLIITLVMAFGIAMIAGWLWMARAVGQGRNWARILCTVLFALATLELTGNHGAVQVLWAMPTWLTGAAAVWLLWRPSSSSYFQTNR
jgi:hypothetical protein